MAVACAKAARRWQHTAQQDAPTFLGAVLQLTVLFSKEGELVRL